MYRSSTPQELIDEYQTITQVAAAARFYGCSVFELMERADREVWIEAWERAVGAEAAASEAEEVKDGD